MANIKVLDQNTINQIAAGEVIERPASVVKELLENAIDAKATAITIEIKEGGISFIRITDNGCGIAKEDIPLAFLRHSTSKIRTAIDLLTVASLGFRGEALSSIAAVSMVELITKSQEAFCGTRYVIEGGEEKSAEDIGVPNGTTFIVRNLFYNTPARRKFLKSATTETSYISDIIEKIALSHPEISIRFICNNQNRLHTSGNGSLKDVIYTVYNREIAANLIEINRECDFMKITGYIGKPIISRGNRSYENYFINGRYIKSGFISRAIEDAYKSFMMQHKYPFTCINIEINPELLDVNVHPTKMELRFRNHEEIYPFTFKVLDDALHKRELIPEVKLDEDENISKAESNTERRAGNKPVNVRMPEPFETERMKSEKHEVKQPEIEKPGIEKHEVKQPEIEKSGIEKHEVKQPEIEKPEVKQPEVEKTLDNLLRENFDYKTKNTTTSIIEKSEQLELFDDRLLSKKARITHKIVGQVFDTYWIVEYDNKMFIIDQHAAHEKVLYERIVKRYRERENLSQEINPPIVVSLNMREEELLKKNMEHFKSFGYEIEEFGGNEYAIRAVPYDLLSLSDRDLFIEFLDSLSPDDKINENIEMLIDRMATMACKAAVKGNNRLSVKEADELIEELLNLDNPYNCPHGRPTIISMTKYEVEKKFKRIV